MKKTVKKAIICSLMVVFMQAGLSVTLIEAAPENNTHTREDQQQQEKQRQEKQHQEQRRYNWAQSAYRDNNWQRTASSYNEPSHFRWHESSYSMRERFASSDYWMEPIHDREWNDRFPGLHSYRWHDNDRYSEGYFWYRGVRIRDAALFYDNWDELVGIGFMFDNVFVFVRDDQAVYHRNDSLLLDMAVLLLAREDRQQWREKKRYDWSQDAYRDNNWNEAAFSYNDPSPFRWHESRYSMRERFSAADYEYRLEPIYDREWNDRFPGLHSYRWHDSDRYSHAGYFWYRGVRIRDAVLLYDDWDELVGIGFMHDNVFVFIRDDQQVHQRNDSLLLGILIFLLAL